MSKYLVSGVSPLKQRGDAQEKKVTSKEWQRMCLLEKLCVVNTLDLSCGMHKTQSLSISSIKILTEKKKLIRELVVSKEAFSYRYVDEPQLFGVTINR